MALTISSARSSRVAGAARPRLQPAVPARRHTTLVVRAGPLSDAFAGIASAFTTIFSPPSHNNVPRSGDGSSYTGRIAHKSGKPFADGFTAGKQQATADVQGSTPMPAADAAEAEEAGNPAMDYVSGAVGRVVGHNFKGDSTEPDWAGTGWKGEIHSKGKDGFHSNSKRH